jgi:hypothetical protein
MTPIHLKIAGLKNVPSAHLEKTLEAVPGVESVELDYEGEGAIVQHEGADPKLLAAAAATIGFRIEVR